MALHLRANDCLNTTTNSTCCNIYDPKNAFPIDILFLNPSTPTCPSPIKILLVLLALNLISITLTLLHALLRRFTPLGTWYTPPTPSQPRPISTFIPLGTFILQTVFTITTGCILHSEDPASDPVMLSILWFARPLPTLLLLLIPFIYSDPTDAFDLALSDFLYRLVALGGFCAAAHATGLYAGLPPLLSNLSLLGFDSTYLPVIKASAALGILGFVASALFIAAQALGAMRYWLWSQWGSTWWVSLLYLVGIHVFYTAGSWLLWAGLLGAVPVGFCPSETALGKVAAVWIFAGVLENVWRGFGGLLVAGDPEGAPVWVGWVREGVEEVFGCFPVERF